METTDINRTLKRRYYLMELAKDAQVFGIVVATLGVEHYLDMVNHLKKLIRDSGRKSYLFVVGKLNVHKLANFAEIDMFVLVACPRNSLVDSKEFYKPIITPFELELALKRGRTWTGDYTTDFRDVLRFVDTPPPAGQPEDAEEEEEEGDMSLITGKIRPQFDQADQSTTAAAIGGDTTALCSVNTGGTMLAVSDMTPAMRYLNQRTFKGLEQQLGQTPPATMKDGMTGIPKGYTHEEHPE